MECRPDERVFDVGRWSAGQEKMKNVEVRSHEINRRTTSEPSRNRRETSPKHARTCENPRAVRFRFRSSCERRLYCFLTASGSSRIAALAATGHPSWGTLGRGRNGLPKNGSSYIHIERGAVGHRQFGPLKKHH